MQPDPHLRRRRALASLLRQGLSTRKTIIDVMPVWAAVFIALVSGVSGGLLGTLAKIADDRGAEVRRAVVDATQDFAALATDWFAAVDAAITACEERNEPDDAKREAAEAVIKQANTRLDRLAVLVGPSSALVRTGAGTLSRVEDALKELPPVLSEIEVDVDEDEMAALSEDEQFERYLALQGASFDERIAEARLLHRHALDYWATFATFAAAELRRGLIPSLRKEARLIRRAARR